MYERGKEPKIQFVYICATCLFKVAWARQYRFLPLSKCFQFLYAVEFKKTNIVGNCICSTPEIAERRGCGFSWPRRVCDVVAEVRCHKLFDFQFFRYWFAPKTIYQIVTNARVRTEVIVRDPCNCNSKIIRNCSPIIAGFFFLSKNNGVLIVVSTTSVLPLYPDVSIVFEGRGGRCCQCHGGRDGRCHR